MSPNLSDGTDDFDGYGDLLLAVLDNPVTRVDHSECSVSQFGSFGL